MISIWGFFICGTPPLTDAWCIAALQRYNEQRNYGRVRGFGSIGYGISGALLGLLLQRFGWKIYYSYIITLLLLTLIIIFFMNDDSKINISNPDSNISIKEGLNQVFKIKPIIIMITII